MLTPNYITKTAEKQSAVSAFSAGRCRTRKTVLKSTALFRGIFLFILCKNGKSWGKAYKSLLPHKLDREGGQVISRAAEVAS